MSFEKVYQTLLKDPVAVRAYNTFADPMNQEKDAIIPCYSLGGAGAGRRFVPIRRTGKFSVAMTNFNGWLYVPSWASLSGADIVNQRANDFGTLWDVLGAARTQVTGVNGAAVEAAIGNVAYRLGPFGVRVTNLSSEAMAAGECLAVLSSIAEGLVPTAIPEVRCCREPSALFKMGAGEGITVRCAPHGAHDLPYEDYNERPLFAAAAAQVEVGQTGIFVVFQGVTGTIQIEMEEIILLSSSGSLYQATDEEFVECTEALLYALQSHDIAVTAHSFAPMEFLKELWKESGSDLKRIASETLNVVAPGLVPLATSVWRAGQAVSNVVDDARDVRRRMRKQKKKNKDKKKK